MAKGVRTTQASFEETLPEASKPDIPKEQLGFRRFLLSGVERPTPSSSSGNEVQHTREKFHSAILDQIEYAEKMIQNGVSEGRKKHTWFFKKMGGYHIKPKYGPAALQLPDGKKSIIAGPQLSDVIQVLKNLVAALEAGELDDELLQARAVLRSRH
jgi:hypothetical protein